MSEGQAVVFVIDDDGKLRCVRIASPRSAPCGANVFRIFCYGSLTFR